MSVSINLSRRARGDIQKIWDYTTKEYGADAADQYIVRLDSSMTMIADYPAIGADYSGIRNGYRKLRSGSHLIFYIPHQHGIEIIRILHERSDIDDQLD